MSNLFVQGDFRLHSGDKSPWKIDCDSLTGVDLRTLAEIIRVKIGHFSEVIGVPSGGLSIADALRSYVNDDPSGPILIVDDVLTTGASMEEKRRETEAWFESRGQLAPEIVGVVLFSRGQPADWIKPVFQMWG